MKINNSIDDEINKIRIDLYEKTKNMSLEEFQDYFSTRAEVTAKKYGFTIAKPLESKGHAQDDVK
jgi:hypothetical protein